MTAPIDTLTWQVYSAEQSISAAAEFADITQARDYLDKCDLDAWWERFYPGETRPSVVVCRLFRIEGVVGV